MMNLGQKQRLIRVLVAAKNNDFAVERRQLAEVVYPRLRRYCMATHGIEFQILDFDGPCPGDGHDEISHYLQQLFLCHEQSLGPGLIAFIDGNEKDISSPRDSGFHQVLDQAFFSYVASKRNEKCLFVIRRQENPGTMHKQKRKYFKNPPEPEPETLKEKIVRYGSSNNVLNFVLHTSENEVLDPTQKHYLQSFCTSMYEHLVQLIDENVNEFSNSNPISGLKPEMTQHWDYAQKLSKNFARENVQDCIKKYLESDSDQVYTIHGPNAQDLSSIIARIACDVREWSLNHGHQNKTTVILRHIGLIPGSDVKIQLLRSICKQLREPREEIPTMEQIEQQFIQIVQNGEHPGTLILFLDSVHLLDDTSWLPKRLANSVKFVVSMTTDSVAMATMRRKCYDSGQYMAVPNLTLDEQVESINVLHRERYHQRLKPNHLKQFSDALESCDKSGYYTSMLVGFAETQRIPLLTAFSTIRSIDACLENQICCVSMDHTTILLHRALGYLAISPAGLSQLELEDVLSLDNEVMKETKGTHTNRIPSKLVCSLIKNLEPLLIPLQIHGIEVYRFRDPTVHAYMYREYGKKSEKYLHSNLADYFLGVWHTRAKAYCDTSHSKRLVIVPEQILIYHPDTKFPVYNKRKLTLLPYHLANSDRTAELKSVVLYNYHWILTKIRALGIPELIHDYTLSNFTEAGIIATAIKESESYLVLDDSILSIELGGRLLAYYNEFAEIKHLVQQCDEQSSGLVPRLPLYMPPDTVLEKCGRIDYGPKYDHELFNNSTIQILSKRKAVGHVKVHDLELNDSICDLIVDDLYKTFLTPDGEYMIHFTRNHDILMHSTETGDLLMKLSYPGDLVYQASLTGRLLAFTMEKSAGPHILDLSQGILIHRLNLQSKMVSLSRCGQYLICDGLLRLNIYTLPLVRRLCTLDIKDCKSVVFAPNQGPTPKGPDFYAVTSTGDVYHVTIDLVCTIPTIKKVIRDVELKELKYSPNDELYMVHCTRTIYVFNTNDELLFNVKSRLPIDGNLTFETVLFTDDSQCLVTVQGVHISVWNRQGKLVRMLVNPNNQNITNAVMKGHNLFTLDADYNTMKWNLSRIKNGTKPKANIHSGTVDNLVMVSSSIVACFGDDTPEITLFNSDSGQKLRTIVPRASSECVIVHVDGSKNGEFLITVQANAEAIFPTAEVVCDANLWLTSSGECLLSYQAIEYAGFSPDNSLAYFLRFTPETGRECIVYDTETKQEKIQPLPPLTILAKPVVDTRGNLRLFTADMEGMDILLWKISLVSKNDYKSVYFNETYMINDIHETDRDDVIHILHTGGLITYDLALHQIMRKLTFPSSPNTIYNRQYTMALDGRRLHDLVNSRNEKLLRIRAAPNMVSFILNDNYLAYLSEEQDKLVIKGVKDGRRRAWCPLHGRGTSMIVCKDDRTILVGCQDGRILALNLVLDAKDKLALISTIPSRAKGRPKTAQQVLSDDINTVILSDVTRRVMSAASGKPSRPNSSLPRPFTSARYRPTSSPAIRLTDRPYTR